MSKFKEPGFNDRQKTAADARKAILEKFKQTPGPDDPAVAARMEERARIAEQREKTRIAREEAKAEAKRIAEEEAAAEATRIAKEAEEATAREAEAEAEAKAARDARYAARKARGKKKR